MHKKATLQLSKAAFLIFNSKTMLVCYQLFLVLEDEAIKLFLKVSFYLVCQYLTI